MQHSKDNFFVKQKLKKNIIMLAITIPKQNRKGRSKEKMWKQLAAWMEY